MIDKELRDRRLRHHYRERYDYRNNLIDFDYTWNFKEAAPSVHFREYKDWRNKGLAFEVRMATYIKANRTMGSYVEGNKSKPQIDPRKDWRELHRERILGRHSMQPISNPVTRSGCLPRI